MENLPLYISVLFGLTVIATVIWFYFATKSKGFLFSAIAKKAIERTRVFRP